MPSFGAGSPLPSIGVVLGTAFKATYQSLETTRFSVNTTVAAPFTLDLGTIISVRMLGIRVTGGMVTLRLTSSVGSDQQIDVSDLFLWHTPFAGSQITAVSMYGIADVEAAIAGDTT